MRARTVLAVLLTNLIADASLPNTVKPALLGFIESIVEPTRPPVPPGGLCEF